MLGVLFYQLSVDLQTDRQKILAQRGLGEPSEPNADPVDRSPSSAVGPLMTEFREGCGRSGCGYLGKYMGLIVSRNRRVRRGHATI